MLFWNNPVDIPRLSMYNSSIDNLGIIFTEKCFEEDRRMDKKMMAVGTSMLLLKLLEKEDMYGYQMIKELEERSESVFSLKEGTLYPLLHTLELQGDIESFEQPAPTGRIRRYYRITPAGRKTLTGKKEEWKTSEKAVNLVLGGVSHA